MQSTYPLDGSALFFGDMDDLSTGWYATTLFIVAEITTLQNLSECLGVLGEQLRKLGVLRSEFLDEGLDEGWVLRHDFAQMLNLGVVRERCEGCASTTCTSTGGAETTQVGSCRRLMLLLLLLLSQLEQVLRLSGLGRLSSSRRGCRSNRLSRRGSRGSGSSGLVQMRRNTLSEYDLSAYCSFGYASSRSNVRGRDTLRHALGY